MTARPNVPTPLQLWTRTMHDLLVDARDELNDDAYTWLVTVGTNLFSAEAARLAVGEAVRAKRDTAGEGPAT